MRVDGAVKSLLQGVSQQPRETRFPGQCTQQINMSSNPVTGLTRRPPLETVGVLGTSATAPEFLKVNYGTDEYSVMMTPTEVTVYEDDGSLYQTITVSDSEIQDYIESGSLKSICMGDTAFITSSNQVVAAETGTMSYSTGSSIVSLLGGQYGRTFSVTVKWSTYSVTGSYTTPNGSVATDILNIASTYIATQLKTALDAIATNSFNTTFTVTRVEDVLWIDSATVTDFSVTVSDGEGGTMIKACNNRVDSIGDLPRFAPSTYLVTISGDQSSGADDYYVQFTLDDGTLTGDQFGAAGAWTETVAPGIAYQLNPATMPLGLVRDPDTLVFTLIQLDWEDRRCGDDDTNPMPSFVGSTIADLGVFQGRLLIVSPASVVMSRTEKPRDFFRKTATQNTDSDVIDMSSTADDVGQFLFCVPHNRDMVIFADGAQFIILGRNTLTPDNCSLILTTSFDTNLEVKPIGAGRNVFFGYVYGTYIGVREFFTMDSIDANDSRPITQHVQNYMPGELQNLIGSSNYDTLWVIPKASTKIYAYEYIWGEQNKVQSSWSTWQLPFAPVTGWISGSEVFFVGVSGTTYTLYKMNLDVHDDTDLDYKVHLDKRKTVTCTAGSIAIPDYSSDLVFVRGTGFSVPGMRLIPKTVTPGSPNTTVKFDTTETGSIIYGIKYTSSYTPTMPVIKDQDGVAVGTGKFTIKEFIFNTAKTGSILYTITSLYRSTVSGLISGRAVGDPRTTVGVEAVQDKQIKIPFRDNVEFSELTISTDSFTPMTLLNMEYRGEYIHKGTRLQQGK